MFERFTERARQVVVLAQDESRALGHNYIGTEHLLLGLLREEEGVAARALNSLRITADAAREQVMQIVGSGEETATGQIPFTPRAKKVLELSLKEAKALGQNYVGTGHLLLGIVRENDGVAARVLLDLDADAERVRTAVAEMLGTEAPADDEPRLEVGQRVTISVSSGYGDTRADRLGIWLVEHSSALIAVIMFATDLLAGWLIWG